MKGIFKTAAFLLLSMGFIFSSQTCDNFFFDLIGEGYIPTGSVEVSAAETEESYTYDSYDGEYDITSASVSITSAGTYRVYGNSTSTSNTITVNTSKNVVLVLDNVVISSSSNPVYLLGNGTTTLILKGTNTLKSSGSNPGLYKGTTGYLIIAAYGNDNSSGNLSAVGGSNSAGIGGGYYGSGYNITINSGIVTATGGIYGAGIGGGYYGSGSNITINGGTVTATSSKGAGIGGGYGGNGSNIAINGGTIMAIGGSEASGIGGGRRCKTNSGNGSNITISGGIVTATGGSYGAGIGGGYVGNGSNITINGGTVTATGASNATSIGNGYKGSGSNIKIYNSSVKVSSISVTPTNADGESVYLYKLSDTTEGSSIYIDGNAFIDSVVYHSSSDTAQYLYLPASADGKIAKVKTDDGITYYNISVSGSTVTFTETSLSKTDLGECELNANSTYTYNGTEQDISLSDFTLTLPDGSVVYDLSSDNFTLYTSGDTVNAGTTYCYIEANESSENYTYKTLVTERIINPKNIADVNVNVTDRQTYDGITSGGELTVTDTVNGEEVILKEGTDYTYTTEYSGSETGIITVTGIGNYTGTVSADFNIANYTFLVSVDTEQPFDVTVTDLSGNTVSYDIEYTVEDGYIYAYVTSDDLTYKTPSIAEADSVTNLDIPDKERLYLFAALVNSGYTTVNGTMTADITVNEGDAADFTDGNKAWTPIGSRSYGYTGTFDGHNYTISGLYYNDISADYVGLFGYINNGTVKNTVVENSSVTGGSYTGGIAGYIDGSTQIFNCINKGSVTASNSYAGGIVGNAASGTVTSCYSTGTVTGGSYAGGVAGANSGTISYCCYLSNTAEGGINGSDVENSAVSKTEEQFASGEAAYLLNSNSSSDVLWYQNIDNDEEADSYPVLDSSHGIVYMYSQVKYCPGNIADEIGYSNTEKTINIINDDHVFTDGKCEQCGLVEYTLYNEPETITETINGNEVDVYQIATASNLKWLSAYVNGGYGEDGYIYGIGVYAELIADIDMDSEEFTPIGTYNHKYQGKFDGNGHIITNLSISDPERKYVGLFGYGNSATIQNVGVEGNICGYTDVGGICGGGSWLSVYNCYFDGEIVGDTRVGGICGLNDYVISNCYNLGTIYSINTTVGGICGQSSGDIYNCYNAGAVDGYMTIGSICGQKYDGYSFDNYYLTGTAKSAAGTIGNYASDTSVEVSASQLASGEVTYLLNNSSSEDVVWYQTLGTDSYPVFKGSVVYDTAFGYSNCENLGDVWIDSVIDEKDAAAVLKYAGGVDVTGNENILISAADVNGDGNVDILDAIAILIYLK